MQLREAETMGTCFGYQIRSPLALNYLRSGPGDPLEIVPDGAAVEMDQEPVIRWVAEPHRPFSARLFGENGGFTFLVDGEGHFRIDASRSVIGLSWPPETPRLEARLWGIPAALCFITRGDVPVHAAAVEVDGSAILFAAPGRHGKTTLASAFVGAGHRLLSEDVSCCRVGERPAVLPGPAMLRVRRDSYEHLEIPGTYPVMEDPDRVHLAVDESLRGDGSPVPIRAVIFLREEREWELEPVPVPEAIRDLWTLSLKLPNDADRTRCFESLADLARRVPVYNLYRHLDFDRLEEDVKRIAEIGSG
jgi:hypothetical protein